jgi:hypothetical protein
VDQRCAISRCHALCSQCGTDCLSLSILSSARRRQIIFSMMPKTTVLPK